MLSDALVGFLRDHAEEVVDGWLRDVRENRSTPSYSRVDAKRLREGAIKAISQFARWLRGDEADEEIREYYRAIGAEHRLRGLELHELISSFSLFRKHLWSFVRTQRILERPIQVYRVLELDRRILRFFDKATYHAAKGWAKQKQLSKE
jgi:hypothetical protein